MSKSRVDRLQYTIKKAIEDIRREERKQPPEPYSEPTVMFNGEVREAMQVKIAAPVSIYCKQGVCSEGCAFIRKISPAMVNYECKLFGEMLTVYKDSIRRSSKCVSAEAYYNTMRTITDE